MSLYQSFSKRLYIGGRHAHNKVNGMLEFMSNGYSYSINAERIQQIDFDTHILYNHYDMHRNIVEMFNSKFDDEGGNIIELGSNELGEILEMLEELGLEQGIDKLRATLHEWLAEAEQDDNLYFTYQGA